MIAENGQPAGADSPSASPPPSPERLEDFFGFLRERIASARKYAAAGRDAWAGGLAAAVIIGAAAGLLPAIRAARLSPVESLWSI